MGDIYCSLSNLKKQLRCVQQELFPIFQSSGVSPVCVLPWKGSVFGTGENYHLLYLRELCAVFGTDFEALDWMQFVKMESFSEFVAVDLNDRKVIVDSFIVQHLLSSGSELFLTQSKVQDTEFENSEFYPLSPYHGIVVGAKNGESQWTEMKWKSFQIFLEVEERIAGALHQGGSHLIPWPESLLRWVNSFE
ncbi:unnamed protein product [Sphagnum jensenii]|uniref:Uncharacterized protein n=1 Tax=Sphagnum jensenii TaxID=128206 RepID=A0ABP0VFE3_9BRYO